MKEQRFFIKTLVIHPSDRSTDFLKQIYAGRDFTVENRHRGEKYPKEEFIKQIRNHDRIIMMGHGHPGGLLYSYVDWNIVPLLRKKECVCIWCNADQFVNYYGLKGFYTGMFISEVGEANCFRIKTTQKKVDFSNELFARLITENIDNPEIYSVLKKNYVGDCPVIQYNNARLYYKNEESIPAMKDFNNEPLIMSKEPHIKGITNCSQCLLPDEN